MPCNCQDVAEKGKQKVEESLAMRLVQDTRKQSKRWFIAWLVTFLALLSVLGGIIYVVLTSDIAVDNIERDGYGVNNYIGNDGDINNGATNTKN
jgi:hypothetical protein